MAERYETPAQGEGEDKKPESAETWLERLKCYRAEFQKWEDQRKNIDSMYAKKDKADIADREYSIFWANLEVLKPATYSRTPTPVVAPRFKDSNRLASAASETLERALVVSFEQDDLNGLMQEVRDDFLMYSRGTGRVRLAERNGSPALAYDHIACADFAHDLKPSWRLVEWAGYRAWMTRDAGVERFGEIFRDVPLKKKDANAVTPDKEDTAPVWEIWDKTSRCVYWVAEDFPLQILDKQDAFLDLSGFFPFPKPAYGTLIPGSLVPVPEIRQYKDQIEEINEYTARIAALSEALRVKGFYPAGAGDISEAIEAAVKSTDNRAILIPISSFAAMGGQSIDKSVIWWPIEQVVETIRALVELRRVVIDDVYQITGISDIVRGSAETGAKKTATEQQLKSQWGSMRIQERQKELVRFARDITRIAGEIIAEEFDPETVVQMAQLQAPTQEMKQQAQKIAQQAQQLKQPVPEEIQVALEKPSVEEIFQLLKNDKARGFLIEIETDSTIQPDEDAEKQRRIEFITAVGGLMREAVPFVLQAPVLGPFVASALKFTAQGFRASRPLEGEIDKLEQLLQGFAKQAAENPPQDPKAAEAKAKAQMEEKRMAMEEQREQRREAREDRKMEMEDARERERMQREETIRREELAQTAMEGEANRQAAFVEAETARSHDIDKRAGIRKQDIEKQFKQMQEASEASGQSFAQSLDKIAMDMRGGFQQASQQREQDAAAIQGVLDKIGGDMQGIAKQVSANTKAIRTVSSEVGNIKKDVAKLAKQVAEIDEDAKAPTEIERDKDGSPIAVKKGKRRMAFKRDGENRITGVQ